LPRGEALRQVGRPPNYSLSFQEPPDRLEDGGGFGVEGSDFGKDLFRVAEDGVVGAVGVFDGEVVG